MYILVYSIVVLGTFGAPAIATGAHEFNSKAACEFAANDLRKENGVSKKAGVMAMCYPKGERDK